MIKFLLLIPLLAFGVDPEETSAQLATDVLNSEELEWASYENACIHSQTLSETVVYDYDTRDRVPYSNSNFLAAKIKLKDPMGRRKEDKA